MCKYRIIQLLNIFLCFFKESIGFCMILKGLQVYIYIYIYIYIYVDETLISWDQEAGGKMKKNCPWQRLSQNKGNMAPNHQQEEAVAAGI